MWSLATILTVGALSYSLCNVRSGNVLTQAICPMIFTLSLVALAVWLYLNAHSWGRRDGNGSSTSGDGGAASSGLGDAGDAGDGGGDGGGGD